ncbi:MAG: hemerythrin domain-containing protein [Paludibacter sp.]|jgi:hemerythrin-like domain-containing protein|nr:hemerythrin domain-containing protein [Paludibacter sp.]
MTPTENLINEHLVIDELLGIMSKIADRIKSKKVFYTDDIEEIIDFLKNYIEKSHHEKEDVFYPALSLAEIPIDKEVISLMSYEHVLTRNYLNDINNCIVKCKIGHAFSSEMLAESLKNYVVLEKNHIQKEVNIIYPIVNNSLTIEKQHEILRQFQQIEEMIEVHSFNEHYSRLLNDLKRKYPN